MRDLPSGTVTFLFTDIEGSTRLLHELGDDYAKVLAEHRRALREAFVRHGGVEVDTQGDAFFVAFRQASEALAAAAEARLALADGPVRVRMGLHTGEPLVTEAGYVGLDVHRAARICAVAHGGQVVVSEQTVNLIDEGLDLHALGLHRLKDLGRPEKLFQLGGEEFPPLRSLNATNLPAQPSPLVGRKRELEELLPLVRQRRLVTLTGPGGTGKTRLALQVAAELVDDFKDGVFWVPLAAITDAELLERAIAQTLGAKGDLAEQVDEKRILLLLDNFEHLLPAAPMLSEWVGRCPNLHLLVTSRALLRLAAEREYLVEPLPEADAVTLFTQRAPHPEAETVVAEVCRRLDGLPLAIELAAARTRIMSASELLDRLGRALPLLTAGPSDAPARQQTLRATIEWSYGLLAPLERTLFGRLAVFSGSFSIEAAEAVCAADLTTLEALVEQSLVRRWESGSLGMLETIHEFALEQLDASGEVEELRRLHAHYYLGVVEEAQPNLREAHWDEWVNLLDAAHPNLRAALEWADRGGKEELKLRLTLALSDFWFARSHLTEGARRFDEALVSDEATPQQRLVILGGAALFACECGLFEQAKSLLEQRLALAREVSDKRRVVDSLRVLGTTYGELGDLARARELLEESVALGNELPTAAAATKTLAFADLGYVLLNEGQYEAAISVYEQALRLFHEQGDTRGVSLCHENIGIAELGSGRPRQAGARLRESLRLAMDIANPPCIVNALVVLAAAEAAERRSRPAAIMLGAEEAFRQRIGYSLQGLERKLRDQALEIVRDDLGDEEVDSAVEEGRALDTEAAVVYSLSLD